jgi:hypothetical protein
MSNKLQGAKRTLHYTKTSTMLLLPAPLQQLWESLAQINVGALHPCICAAAGSGCWARIKQGIRLLQHAACAGKTASVMRLLLES